MENPESVPAAEDKYPWLNRENGFRDLYFEWSLMELARHRGLPFDTDYLEALAEKCRKSLAWAYRESMSLLMETAQNLAKPDTPEWMRDMATGKHLVLMSALLERLRVERSGNTDLKTRLSTLDKALNTDIPLAGIRDFLMLSDADSNAIAGARPLLRARPAAGPPSQETPPTA